MAIPAETNTGGNTKHDSCHGSDRENSLKQNRANGYDMENVDTFLNVSADCQNICIQDTEDTTLDNQNNCFDGNEESLAMKNISLEEYEDPTTDIVNRDTCIHRFMVVANGQKGNSEGLPLIESFLTAIYGFSKYVQLLICAIWRHMHLVCLDGQIAKMKSDYKKSYLESVMHHYILPFFEDVWVSVSAKPVFPLKTKWKEFLSFPQNISTNIVVFPAFTLQDQFRDIEANPNMSESEKMMHDMIRTSTFSNFPSDCPVSSLTLVKAGFYYKGNADEVICFSCGAKHCKWRHKDDPVAIHKAISPSCTFINPTNNPNENQDLEVREENENYILYARETGSCDTQSTMQNNFREQKQSNTNSVCSQTQGTFTLSRPYRQNLDRNQRARSELRSQYLHNMVSDQSNSTNNLSTPNNNMTQMGRQQSKNNIDMQLQNSSSNENQTAQNSQTREGNIRDHGNKSAKDTLEPLGISIEKPKYPQYAVLATRLSSFRNWPKHLKQNVEEMAKAGFIYEGTSDFARCFFCAGGLRDWEPEDNPWNEHARWYQNCVFLRQCRGEEFVNLVQKGNTKEAFNKLDGGSKKPNNQPIDSNVLNIPAVISVLEMGYDDTTVKEALKTCTKTQGIDKLKAEEILQAVWDLEEKGRKESNSSSPIASSISGDKFSSINNQNDCSAADHETLMAENRELREQQICKICMDEDISIVFLPCGHMVTCVNCAPALRKCPLCRRFIKGTVKAILS